MVALKEVKNSLKKHRLRPSKKLGQNFLIDKTSIRKIIAAADLQPGDVVLEIGPGPGSLTQELAKRVTKVIAVEKDKNMVAILKEQLECLNVRNVQVVLGDILKIEPRSFAKSRGEIENSFKIVGNLPFYLTAPVIRKFLESENPPKEMILVVQKEVAQRICAKPPDMNLLAVAVQFYASPSQISSKFARARPKIISYISRRSFWPSPKVDSAIIKIVPHNGTRTVLVPLFFKIVRAGFSQPRKQLANNFSKMLKLDKETVKSWLWKNHIKPEQRAETLSLEDWKNLTKSASGTDV